MDFWTSTYDISENSFLFVFISSFVSFKLKSLSKKYVTWTRFKFWPMKKIFQELWANNGLVMACLQNYREQLSLATFRRFHSNSKEASYLPWQKNILTEGLLVIPSQQFPYELNSSRTNSLWNISNLSLWFQKRKLLNILEISWNRGVLRIQSNIYNGNF